MAFTAESPGINGILLPLLSEQGNTLFILRLNLLLTRGVPSAFRDGILFLYRQPSYAIGSVLSLSGHAFCVLMAFTAESPPAQGQ